MLLKIKNIILILTLSLYDVGNAETGKDLYSSINRFVLDVKNNSDGMVDFATKVHSIFCPDQPVCQKDGTFQEGKDTLGAFPAYLSVGSSTVKLEDVHNIVGICCLPCSCSDDCKENNNCCPSKVHFENDLRNEPLMSECIVPHSDSYSDKNVRFAGYFMVTQCFKDESNNTVVELCEHPSKYRLDETGPVTSLKTRRTYWNKYCALCNRDAGNIIKWEYSVTFPEFIFFGNQMSSFLYPETFADWHDWVASVSDVTYIPPFSMKHNVCIRNESMRSSCLMAESDGTVVNDEFLMQACQQFYNPVVFTNKLGRQHPYTNIFCSLCWEKAMRPIETPECQFETGSRRSTGSKQITAILDYESEKNSKLEPSTNKRKSKCSCSQVYDSFMGRCRALFCPVGEFLVGCRCKQPLQNISGIPVLLKLRVIPKTDRANKMTQAHMGKYHTALENMLQNTVKDMTATTVATFVQETKTGVYYLSMVIARSNPGHDTVKTMKPFLAYLDSEKELDFKVGKIAYITKVTDRILLARGVNTKTLAVRATDLDKDDLDVDPIAIYTDDNFVLSNLKRGAYQPFSPLLYCMQVKLNGSEYVEEDYGITVNTTTSIIPVPYYYKMGGINQVVRICVDQYLPKRKNIGTRPGFKPIIWVITLNYMAIKRFT